MKKAFLVVAGILFVVGANSDASAQPNIQAPAKAQVGYHANDVEGTVEFISRRQHRRHNQGYFRGNRHGRYFGHGYRDHRQGYNRPYYGGRDPYRLYKPYGNYYSGRHFYRGRDLYSPYRPYGNYYSGRHFYRGRGYSGYGNHGRHDRRRH